MNTAGGLGVAALLVALSGVASEAQSVYRVNTRSQWLTWTFPRDLLEIRNDGSVTPVAFDQPANVALNAPLFTHALREGGEGQGGVWKVGSGRSTAGNLMAKVVHLRFT